MADPFKDYASGLDSPAANLAEITPNDSADLSTSIRAISCETAGRVFVDAPGVGTNVDIYLVAGVPFPQRITRVYSTGTTALRLRGHW